jgi:sugar porter (SP) family MFS transporter
MALTKVYLLQVAKFQGGDPSTATLVLTANHQNLVFCLPLVGSIIGAAAAAPLTTRFGRKWPIVVAYVLSVPGTFLQTFAPNLAAFVVGRLFNSIMLAMGTTIAPLYLSEVVPARFRGRAVTSTNIFNLISGVIATVICNSTHTMNGSQSYRIPLGAQAVLPVFMIPVTIFLPESPLWLLSKGRTADARNNLRKLRAFDDSLVDSELRVMQSAYEDEARLSEGVTFFDLFSRKNIKRTLVAGSMYSVNQCSGIILSSTYATIFLTTLGVGNPFQLTIAASCCILAGTLIAVGIVDRLGRRPTAIIGMSVLLAIDIAAGTLAFFIDKPNVPIAIAALSFIFNGFWAASFYSLSVTLPTEIPEPRLRNMTNSYTLGCAYTTAVITTFAVPQLVSADAANLGAKTYLVFGGIVAIILTLYYIYLPETSGRTFAEINEMYEQKIPPRKWKGHKTSAEHQETKVMSG